MFTGNVFGYGDDTAVREALPKALTFAHAQSIQREYGREKFVASTVIETVDGYADVDVIFQEYVSTLVITGYREVPPVLVEPAERLPELPPIITGGGFYILIQYAAAYDNATQTPLEEYVYQFGLCRHTDADWGGGNRLQVKTTLQAASDYNNEIGGSTQTPPFFKLIIDETGAAAILKEEQAVPTFWKACTPELVHDAPYHPNMTMNSTRVDTQWIPRDEGRHWYSTGKSEILTYFTLGGRSTTSTTVNAYLFYYSPIGTVDLGSKLNSSGATRFSCECAWVAPMISGGEVQPTIYMWEQYGDLVKYNTVTQACTRLTSDWQDNGYNGVYLDVNDRMEARTAMIPDPSGLRLHVAGERVPRSPDWAWNRWAYLQYDLDPNTGNFTQNVITEVDIDDEDVSNNKTDNSQWTYTGLSVATASSSNTPVNNTINHSIGLNYTSPKWPISLHQDPDTLAITVREAKVWTTGGGTASGTHTVTWASAEWPVGYDTVDTYWDPPTNSKLKSRCWTVRTETRYFPTVSASVSGSWNYALYSALYLGADVFPVNDFTDVGSSSYVYSLTTSSAATWETHTGCEYWQEDGTYDGFTGAQKPTYSGATNVTQSLNSSATRNEHNILRYVRWAQNGRAKDTFVHEWDDHTIGNGSTVYSYTDTVSGNPTIDVHTYVSNTQDGTITKKDGMSMKAYINGVEVYGQSEIYTKSTTSPMRGPYWSAYDWRNNLFGAVGPYPVKGWNSSGVDNSAYIDLRFDVDRMAISSDSSTSNISDNAWEHSYDFGHKACFLRDAADNYLLSTIVLNPSGTYVENIPPPNFWPPFGANHWVDKINTPAVKLFSAPVDGARTEIDARSVVAAETAGLSSSYLSGWMVTSSVAEVVPDTA